MHDGEMEWNGMYQSKVKKRLELLCALGVNSYKLREISVMWENQWCETTKNDTKEVMNKLPRFEFKGARNTGEDVVSDCIVCSTAFVFTVRTPNVLLCFKKQGSECKNAVFCL